MPELKRLESLLSPRERQAIEEARAAGQKAAFQCRALLSYMRLADERHVGLCLAKSGKLKEWLGWSQDAPPESHTTDLITPGMSEHQLSNHRRLAKKARLAREAHEEWVRERRKLFQPLSLPELEGHLRGVYQAYCDRKLYMATGRQMMNVNGWMRLLHDVGLLDSVITPVTADAIFTGVQHGAEELTPPQDIHIPFEGFTARLRVLAMHRGGTHTVPASIAAVLRAPSPRPKFEDIPNMDLDHELQRAVNSNLSLSCRIIRDPHLPRSTSGNEKGFSNSAAGGGSKGVNPKAAQVGAGNRSNDAHAAAGGLAAHFAATAAGGEEDGHPRGMGPSFTADGMSSVRSRMSFMTGSAGGRGRNSGGDRHKGQGIDAERLYTRLLKRMVLPAALPQGTEDEKPVLDGLYCRQTLDILRHIEPQLRRLFVHYALLDEPVADINWDEVMRQDLRVSGSQYLMLLTNFEVMPLLLTRQTAIECYASHSAADRSSALLDGGRHYTAFLETIASAAIATHAGLGKRIRVHSTPEELQAVRIYINHAEQEISIGLMSRLAVVEAKRRLPLDDVGAAAKGLSFYDYQAERLKHTWQAQQQEASNAALLGVLSRREETRQKLALTRLRNFYADVRSIASGTWPLHSKGQTGAEGSLASGAPLTAEPGVGREPSFASIPDSPGAAGGPSGDSTDGPGTGATADVSSRVAAGGGGYQGTQDYSMQGLESHTAHHPPQLQVHRQQQGSPQARRRHPHQHHHPRHQQEQGEQRPNPVAFYSGGMQIKTPKLVPRKQSIFVASPQLPAVYEQPWLHATASADHTDRDLLDSPPVFSEPDLPGYRQLSPAGSPGPHMAPPNPFATVQVSAAGPVDTGGGAAGVVAGSISPAATMPGYPAQYPHSQHPSAAALTQELRRLSEGMMAARLPGSHAGRRASSVSPGTAMLASGAAAARSSTATAAASQHPVGTTAPLPPYMHRASLVVTHQGGGPWGGATTGRYTVSVVDKLLVEERDQKDIMAEFTATLPNIHARSPPPEAISHYPSLLDMSRTSVYSLSSTRPGASSTISPSAQASSVEMMTPGGGPSPQASSASVGAKKGRGRGAPPAVAVTATSGAERPAVPCAAASPPTASAPTGTAASLDAATHSSQHTSMQVAGAAADTSHSAAEVHMPQPSIQVNTSPPAASQPQPPPMAQASQASVFSNHSSSGMLGGPKGKPEPGTGPKQKAKGLPILKAKGLPLPPEVVFGLQAGATLAANPSAHSLTSSGPLNSSSSRLHAGTPHKPSHHAPPPPPPTLPLVTQILSAVEQAAAGGAGGTQPVSQGHQLGLSSSSLRSLTALQGGGRDAEDVSDLSVFDGRLQDMGLVDPPAPEVLILQPWRGPLPELPHSRSDHHRHY